MPIPCTKRDANVPSVARPKEPSQKGNGTKSYADTAGMERAADNKVALDPEWDGPSRVVRTTD